MEYQLLLEKRYLLFLKWEKTQQICIIPTDGAVDTGQGLDMVRGILDKEGTAEME